MIKYSIIIKLRFSNGEILKNKKKTVLKPGKYLRFLITQDKYVNISCKEFILNKTLTTKLQRITK